MKEKRWKIVIITDGPGLARGRQFRRRRAVVGLLGLRGCVHRTAQGVTGRRPVALHFPNAGSFHVRRQRRLATPSTEHGTNEMPQPPEHGITRS
jgi:hypothetical protein